MEPQSYRMNEGAQADDGHDGAPTTSQDLSEDRLFTYAIARGDLAMEPGKLASQAIHASRISLLKFLRRHPDRSDEFISMNSCGSAVTLRARHLADLERARDEAERAGLPWALFTDSQHVMAPHFDGSPVTTMLAIGPAPREAMRHITRRFRCV